MDESHSAAFEVRQIHVVNVIIFVTVIFVNVFLCLYRQSHAPVNDIVHLQKHGSKRNVKKTSINRLRLMLFEIIGCQKCIGCQSDIPGCVARLR